MFGGHVLNNGLHHEVRLLSSYNSILYILDTRQRLSHELLTSLKGGRGERGRERGEREREGGRERGRERGVGGGGEKEEEREGEKEGERGVRRPVHVYTFV